MLCSYILNGKALCILEHRRSPVELHRSYIYAPFACFNNHPLLGGRNMLTTKKKKFSRFLCQTISFYCNSSNTAVIKKFLWIDFNYFLLLMWELFCIHRSITWFVISVCVVKSNRFKNFISDQKKKHNSFFFRTTANQALW